MLTASIEISAKHVHLNKQDAKILFPLGLTKKRNLTIDGEFVCNEKIIIHGERTTTASVMGPIRPFSQLELCFSDCYHLGLDIPDRNSGDIKDAPSVRVSTDYGETLIPCIIPIMHIHCNPNDIISCFDVLDVCVNGPRSQIKFNNVNIRPTKGCTHNIIHMNTDEGNTIRGKNCSIIISSLRLANPMLYVNLTTTGIYKSAEHIEKMCGIYTDTVSNMYKF